MMDTVGKRIGAPKDYTQHGFQNELPMKRCSSHARFGWGKSPEELAQGPLLWFMPLQLSLLPIIDEKLILSPLIVHER